LTWPPRISYVQGHVHRRDPTIPQTRKPNPIRVLLCERASLAGEARRARGQTSALPKAASSKPWSAWVRRGNCSSRPLPDLLIEDLAVDVPSLFKTRFQRDVASIRLEPLLRLWG
jgi:hypothetical protein